MPAEAPFCCPSVVAAAAATAEVATAMVAAAEVAIAMLATTVMMTGVPIPVASRRVSIDAPTTRLVACGHDQHEPEKDD